MAMWSGIFPFVRAIESAAGGQATFIAPRTSRAKDLLTAEPTISETIFRACGSELERGMNLIGLARLLRRIAFADATLCYPLQRVSHWLSQRTSTSESSFGPIIPIIHNDYGE
jgi:hypothetical protein